MKKVIATERSDRGNPTDVMMLNSSLGKMYEAELREHTPDDFASWESLRSEH